MVIRTLLLAAAGLAAAAPAAGASPFLRNALEPCYVSAGPAERQAVTIDAGGFVPYAPIQLTVDGVPQPVVVDGAAKKYAVSDANGDLHGDVQAPWQPSGQRPFSLQLTDQADAADTLALMPTVTALSVAVMPAQARPSHKVTFSGSGFTEARPLFAHYLFRGRLRKTVRLGRPAAPCGTFAFRARQIPVRHPRTGQWTVQFDQRRRYGTVVPPVSERLLITVRRVPRARGSRSEIAIFPVLR